VLRTVFIINRDYFPNSIYRFVIPIGKQRALYDVGNCDIYKHIFTTWQWDKFPPSTSVFPCQYYFTNAALTRRSNG
jgi:hypothetical protein